jgi:hypothetical protein
MQQAARWFTPLVEHDRSVKLFPKLRRALNQGMTIRYQGMTWRYLWVTGESVVGHHLMEIRRSNS